MVPAARPFDLRAAAEGGPDLLSSDLLEPLIILNLRLGDPGAIVAANQFNEPAPPGQHWIAATYVATVKPSVTNQISYFDVQCSLVGDKGKVYEPASISDVEGALNLLSDQPDVIGGGSIGGDVYYLVDDDDANLMALCGRETFIIPG